MKDFKMLIILLLNNEIPTKLLFLFKLFDTNNSHLLPIQNLIDIICQIESLLDGRSHFYRSQCSSLMNNLIVDANDEVSELEFIRCAMNDPGVMPILQCISAISGADFRQVPIMKQVHTSII